MEQFEVISRNLQNYIHNYFYNSRIYFCMYQLKFFIDTDKEMTQSCHEEEWGWEIPLRVAKPRVVEFTIPHESRKAHFNSHTSHNFSPRVG